MLENENTINQVPVRKTKKVSLLKRYLPLILVILVIILGITSAYFYKKSANNPNAISQAEVKSLVNKVGLLMILPEGETPTIATVSDPEALKDQAFFVDAKKGDKVLIYSNAKKAILYDPKADKIVNIAPLNAEAPAPTTTPDTSKSPASGNKKN